MSLYSNIYESLPITRTWCKIDGVSTLIIASQDEWGLAIQASDDDSAIKIEFVDYSSVEYKPGVLRLAYQHPIIPSGLSPKLQLVYLQDPSLSDKIDRTGIPGPNSIRGKILEHEVVPKLVVDDLLQDILKNFTHLDEHIRWIKDDGTPLGGHQFLLLRASPGSFPIMAVALETSSPSFKFGGRVLVPRAWISSSEPVFITFMFRWIDDPIQEAALEISTYFDSVTKIYTEHKVRPEVRELIVTALRSFNLESGFDEDESLVVD